MKDITLLILAGGMGSRFGGLKQIESVGPNGEFIIDYSIYDAIKAGFTKVVFVIKEENNEIFKETIGKRIEDKIKVEYAYQRLEDIPDGFELPKDRVKPLGTGQAILAARDKISENFGIISADDFYGRDAFEALATFLKSNDSDDTYVTIGYRVENTLSVNGSVKRGLFIGKDGKVVSIKESRVEKENGKLIAYPLDGTDSFEITGDILASMIMFGLKPSVFDLLEKYFPIFLNEDKDNLDSFEYLFPVVLERAINNGECEIEILNTDAKWYGMTYKEDLEEVKEAVLKYTNDNIYPKDLWK